MNTVSSSDHPSYYNTIRPSPSYVPRQVELEDHEAFTPYDVPFSDDFLGVGGLSANPFPVFYPPASPPPSFQHVTHPSVIGQPQRIGRSPHGPQRPRSFSDPFIHPAVAPQSPFDGTYSLQMHPSAWHPAAPGPGSSAIYASGGGGQAALAGVPVPSMTGTVPMAPGAAAPPFFPPTHVTTSRSPAGVAVVRPWDAVPTGASGSGPPPGPPVPTPFCRCHLRAHPLVRVDDMIEWVRPDLMRMSVWFNWSQNADAEAHESWERRRA